MERERNDCSVYALHVASGLDYATLLAWSHETGRRRNAGTTRHQRAGLFVLVSRNTSVRFRQLPGARGTIATFAKRHPEGRYFVRVGHHFAPVVDGFILDHTKETKRVTHAWRVLIPTTGESNE